MPWLASWGGCVAADWHKILRAHPHRLTAEETSALRQHRAGLRISDEQVKRLTETGHLTQKLGGYQVTDIGNMHLAASNGR